LVITESNLIVSGVRRYKAALELGMTEVPVVMKDPNENEVSESKFINHQQHRVKGPVQIYIEIERLSEKFNLVQGRKKFKFDEEEASEKKKQLFQLISKGTYNRLKTAHKNLSQIIKSKDEVYQKLIEMERSEKLNPKSILDRSIDLITEAKRKANKNSKKKPRDFKNNYKILNQSSKELWKGIANKINCIICSVPYWGMRDYGTDKKQIGLENTIEEYMANLIQVFSYAHKALKEDGSLFVNIADVFKNGSYQNIPGIFITEMMKNNWKMNATILWKKKNPIYQDANRPMQSYEHIIHFVKTTNFKYFKGWEKEIPNVPDTLCYGDFSKKIILRDFWDFRHLTIDCPVANNEKLTKKLKELGIDHNHSATFPIEIPTACILSTTEPGDVVVDCFSGLGTSGIAAIGHNRYYYGIENNSDYIEASKYRLEMFIEDMEKRVKDDKVEDPKKKYSTDWLVSNDLDDEFFDYDIERELDDKDNIQYELETYKKAA